MENISHYQWNVDEEGDIEITITFEDDSADVIIFDKASIQRMLIALEKKE